MTAEPNLLLAFGLTLFAGLATGIGSALAFFTDKTNTRFLSSALGFSAGVMLYVSFVEILAKARDAIAVEMAEKPAAWITAAGFFGGMFIAGLIDKLVPNFENPHEIRNVEDMEKRAELEKNHRLMRMGIFSALAIAIHNFPEGLATFAAAIQNPTLGITIAIAIAIHNIPEGIAVSVPVYYATGSRRKAFKLSFLSGLAEPLGALIGYLVFRTFFTEFVFGILFASVAGIMVFISLDELIPSAEKYGEHHFMISGLIAGMAVMALSLLLFM